MSEPPRKRRRPAVSCTQCRRRKIKCDRSIPCNNCTKSRVGQDCDYVAVQAQTNPVQTTLQASPDDDNGSHTTLCDSRSGIATPASARPVPSPAPEVYTCASPT